MSLVLINKQDSFEIVRDQIAAILVLETANQMTLAAAASEDPELWRLQVFTERSDPWEQWVNLPDDHSEIEAPIVNIWYDNSSFDGNASSVMERQKTIGIFNIDVYGLGVAQDVMAGGHKPGDLEAVLVAQRAMRLVRNILMAAENTYLQLPRGFVGSRWPQSVNAFQPQLDGRAVQKVAGMRLALRVTFNEFSPQVVPETLELLTVRVKRVEDGQVVINADYDYT